MEVLLRYVRQGRNGVTDVLDTHLSAVKVFIGSASESTLQLLGRAVASRHARIERGSAGFRLCCERGQHCEINGTSQSSANLNVGDVIAIGGHRLSVLEPPSGFDLSIEIHPDAKVVAGDFEAAFVTDLGRTWLSMRSASWFLLALTVLLSFAIPLSSIYLHRSATSGFSPLPDDAFWSSGPLTAAHAHAAGKQCATCHQHLFQHVQDAACRDCHKDTLAHISAANLPLTHFAGSQQRCGECHAEHLGDASQMSVQNDRLCLACHADPGKKFGTLKIKAVTGFEPDQHPAFSVTMQRLATALERPGADSWITERVNLSAASESANLTFSHSAHLDGKVTRVSDGGALGCADCHALSADGEHFQAMTMAGTCATSGCHVLNFDTAAGDRQLPHGKPRDAVWVIEDYFTRKYFDPAASATHPMVRRLPDQDRLPPDTVDNCTGTALSCAREHARLEIENQFLGRGCHLCHTVQDTGNTDVHDRFQVVPVRLAVDYFPQARFPHKPHAIQGDLSGDDACESCHRARQSTQASQLLLPDVDRCFKCHRDQRDAATTNLNAGANKPQIVTVKCISCHLYHPAASSPVARQAEKEKQ